MSIELIKELCEINAISGHEKPVREFLDQQLAKKADHIMHDNLGSVVYKFAGKTPGKNIAIIAHMDEVGMMVKQITDRGFIKIVNVGGLVVESLLTQHVELITNSGQIHSGAILGVSPHNYSGDKLKIEDITIDFGFDSKEDALSHGVKIGDQIILRSEFRKLANDKLMSKAFDNRLGCAAICEIAQRLKNYDYSGNIYLGASVQEEVGLRGASTIMNAMDEEIDYVLVIDVSPIDDAHKKADCALGEGTLIRLKDPRMILDVSGVNVLRSLSEKHGIKVQEFFSTGGCDAAQIQIQNKGYVTNALCVPGRNLHTNNSIIDYKDYQATVNLTVEYIKEILGEK